MPTNHHAMIRYQALDRCLSNPYRKYFIEDLVKECCKAIYEYDGIENGVKVRQIWDDLKYMKSDQGWQAPILTLKDGRRSYFRYEDKDFSINKRPLNQEEMTKLHETLYMVRRFKGLPQFSWIDEIISRFENDFGLTGQKKSVIGFEQNMDYKGIQYLTDLFNAIVNKQVLKINYKKFSGEERDWVLHPYYIKQYNNRWFLYGLNNKLNVVTNIALDRITSLALEKSVEYKDTDIDFEEYFDDVIGVTIKNAPVEDIKLRFSTHRFPYVMSKPLHLSMKVLDKEEGLVQISVIPNNELEQMIFSFGNDVEVIEPLWLRINIGNKIVKLAEIYKRCISLD